MIERLNLSSRQCRSQGSVQVQQMICRGPELHRLSLLRLALPEPTLHQDDSGSIARQIRIGYPHDGSFNIRPSHNGIATLQGILDACPIGQRTDRHEYVWQKIQAPSKETTMTFKTSKTATELVSAHVGNRLHRARTAVPFVLDLKADVCRGQI